MGQGWQGAVADGLPPVSLFVWYRMGARMGTTTIFIGAVVLLAARVIARSAWIVVKVAIFLAICWGALKSVGDSPPPGLSALVSFARSASPDFYGAAYLIWVADNWMPVAIFVVFLLTVLRERDVKKLTETSNHARIFIGMMSKYLNVTGDTPDLVRLRKEGARRSFVHGLKRSVVDFFLGTDIDYLYDAHPIRDGRKVTFKDDFAHMLRDVDEGMHRPSATQHK